MLKRTRYRISFHPCTHCGYITDEKEGRDNGTWCWEHQLDKKWLCGKCQIGYCKPKEIIDRIEV